MATYPAGVYSPREKENIPGVVYAAGEKQRFFVEDIDNTDAEIIAIQNKLGIVDAVINKCGGMKPHVNAIDAVQIQNVAGANILNVDTLNLRVGIGNAAPSVSFHVVGSTKLQGAAEITGDFTLTGKTQGSIFFAGASSVVSQDNANLFWDNANNRLGIGIATPSFPLHVYEISTDARVQIQTLSAGIASLAIVDASGGVIYLRGDANDSYINTGGDFGLGISNPTHRLTVYDNVNGYSAKFINDGNLSNRAGIVVQAGADTGSGTTYFFRANDGNGTLTGYLQTVGGVFAVADVSDKRRKTNIKDTAMNGLNIINGLKVRDFNWKVNPKGPKMRGFIAQEAQKVFPELVSKGENGLLTTSRSELIPVLVKAIQEQQKQIDDLKNLIGKSS